jgi:hypothetical protein
MPKSTKPAADTNAMPLAAKVHVYEVPADKTPFESFKEASWLTYKHSCDVELMVNGVKVLFRKDMSVLEMMIGFNQFCRDHKWPEKCVTPQHEPQPGSTILKDCGVISGAAKALGENVVMEFNEVLITAKPGDEPEDLAKYYSDECNRRHEAYISTPEYKERQAAAEKAQQEKEDKLAAALAKAPAEFSYSEGGEEKWNTCKSVNSDGYGSGVVRFAHRWARLMEAEIANNPNSSGVISFSAKDLSHLADNEGITGFMYGAAVSILAQVWKHGDELRRWHNLDTQIGNEGEKANESGGTLNPACLSIGTK